jgi:hypothetical protein
MNRPKGLLLTSWLMAVLSILGWTVIDLRSYRPPHHTHSAFVILVTIIVTMKIGALICVWYFCQGGNWARVAVLLTSVWTVYNLRLLTHGNVMSRGIVYGGVIAVQGFLGLFFLYWLNTSEIRRFFSRGRRLASIDVNSSRQ